MTYLTDIGDSNLIGFRMTLLLWEWKHCRMVYHLRTVSGDSRNSSGAYTVIAA